MVRDFLCPKKTRTNDLIGIDKTERETIDGSKRKKAGHDVRL